MKPHELRTLLAEALEKVNRGEMSHEAARDLVSLATQYTQSLAVECKVVKVKLALGEVLGRGEVLRLGQ